MNTTGNQSQARVPSWLTASAILVLLGCGAGAPPPTGRSTQGLTSTSTLYSRYVGGSSDDTAQAIAVDPDGTTYVVGQASRSGYNSDALILKLGPDGSLLGTRYLGGTSSDTATGVAIGADGSLYVTGWTMSGSGFPNPTNTPVPSYAGGNHCPFVAKLDRNTLEPTFSSILDIGPVSSQFGIAADSSGNAYVVGSLSGYAGGYLAKAAAGSGAVTTWEVFPSGEPRGVAVGCHDGGCAVYVAGTLTPGTAFVKKYNLDGSAAYGPVAITGVPYNAGCACSAPSANAGQWGRAVTVDTNGNAHVTGEWATYFNSDAFYARVDASGTLSINKNIGHSKCYNPCPTPDAYGAGATIARSSAGDLYVAGFVDDAIGHDVTLRRVTSDGIVVDSSRFGGVGAESGNGVALDAHGGVYVAGTTGSTDFPVNPTGLSSYGGGGSDPFVLKVGY